ncbi:ComEC/Rec2 family competence protein [Amycolatopsis nigrescens]|uniref:ComEC/Rec2 family competence protein n=1 Tax=Amycolatopsis nigrescens TaxID=381445 RepID=UPI00036AF393|nr:ComEC/Rec2 family competence protein [Amycolatopsis nigrescens]
MIASVRSPTVSGTPEPVVRHDFRLIPVAVAGWLGALLGLLCGWWVATVTGLVTALAAVVLFRRVRTTRPRWVAAAFALLIGGLTLAGPLALRLWQAERDPLRVPALRGDVVTLRVSVAERPEPVRAAGYAGQQAGARSVVIAAEVVTAAVDGVPVRSTGKVVLIAPFERWSALLPGQLVSTSGSLAPARAAELTAASVYVRGPPEEVGPAPWWQDTAASLREGLRQAASVLAEEPAGLLPGLVLGDTSRLSPRLEREFETAGMTHLLAVSGSNLVIICGAVLLLLRAFRVGPRLSAALAGAALLGFVVLVGPEPSVLRAGVMGAVGLLALALGRKRSALPALAAAVCVLVAFDPAMAASFGFALSVLATAGLVLLAPRWADALSRRGVPPGLAEGLAVPAAAFLVTAPVIAGMAGRLSLVAVAANVLAAPVVAPATVLGVLATVVAVVSPAAAGLLMRLAGPEADWLITVARRAAAVPGANLPWPGGWWGGLSAAVVAAVLVFLLRYRRLRVGLAVLLAGMLLVLIPVRVIAPAWPPPNWAVVACDVGQGDAAVLATAEPGRAVVVDVGPEPGPVDECLDRLDVDRVPLVVLSHLHADHIAGLDSAFDGRVVGAIAVGPGRSPDWAWRQVSEVAGRHGVPLLELEIGTRMEWPGLSIEVLGPSYVSSRSGSAQDGTGINNTSVVLRAETPAGRMLLTGDVELAAQADLLAGGADLRAEILKVPHHGSRSALPQFVSAIRPRAALISVGAGNAYGHPSKHALDLLGAAGALVARTDTDGDTAVLPDLQGPALTRRGRQRAPPAPCRCQQSAGR